MWLGIYINTPALPSPQLLTEFLPLQLLVKTPIIDLHSNSYLSRSSVVGLYRHDADHPSSHDMFCNTNEVHTVDSTRLLYDTKPHRFLNDVFISALYSRIARTTSKHHFITALLPIDRIYYQHLRYCIAMPLSSALSLHRDTCTTQGISFPPILPSDFLGKQILYRFINGVWDHLILTCFCIGWGYAARRCTS